MRLKRAIRIVIAVYIVITYLIWLFWPEYIEYVFMQPLPILMSAPRGLQDSGCRTQLEKRMTLGGCEVNE